MEPEEPILEAGGDPDEIHVTLSVSGDCLVPDDITRLLGTTPTFAAPKRQERASSGGKMVVQRTGGWLYELPHSTEWLLGDAIDTLLRAFPADPTIWERLRTKYAVTCRVGLHLSAWNRGAEVSAEVIRQLAERGMSLDLDIYFYEEDA